MLRVLILAVMMLAASPAPAGAKKKRVDRLVGVPILGIKVGFDTIKTVQEKLGPSELRRLSGDADPPTYLCYRSESGLAWFWFQSGAVGAFEVIDHIVVASHPRRADEKCALLPDAPENAGLGKLTLRTSRQQLVKLLDLRSCEGHHCETSETREIKPKHGEPYTLTLSLIVELRADAVDSLTIWRD